MGSSRPYETPFSYGRPYLKGPCKMTTTSLEPDWLQETLPDDPCKSLEWLEILRFFLINSPCCYQSNRRYNINNLWGPGPWIQDYHLKRPLNQIVFGSKECLFVKVNKKADLDTTLMDLRLDNDFTHDVDRQVAVFTKAPNKGNSNTYMSLFYHLRNALAHGRFGFVKDSTGNSVFLFEDGSGHQKPPEFELTARGIIRFDSLLGIIRTIEKGPEALPDFESQILAAIKSGINTKKRIIEALDLEENDWRTYSQVLRKEGKITASKNKWSLTKQHSQ